MKSKIQVTWSKGLHYYDAEPTISKFPGGELHVRFDEYLSCDYCTINALIVDSDGIMAVALLKNILDLQDIPTINLHLEYMPYARQDRVCREGESFSLKVFANILNGLNFDKVYISDPHSDVAPALLNNVEVVSQKHLFLDYTIEHYSLRKLLLVSPDAGANKKTLSLAMDLGHEGFIRADKVRNTEDGSISGTVVYGDVRDKDVLIVDDICDGGGTFCLLAAELKALGAKSVTLYVTHGIFSKGKDVLHDAGVDHIHCYYDWTKELV